MSLLSYYDAAISLTGEFIDKQRSFSSNFFSLFLPSGTFRCQKLCSSIKTADHLWPSTYQFAPLAGACQCLSAQTKFAVK